MIDEVRHGNRLAFEVIYLRYHRGLLSLCTHMLRSQEEGEDALQQTFLSAYRALNEDLERPTRLGPWLYTIARNRCVSTLRGRRSQAERVNEEQAIAVGPSVAAHVEDRSDVKDLFVDLAKLPDSQREALILSEMGDLAHTEVAEVLGCDRAKVKSLVFQARSALVERREARQLGCRDVREEVANLGSSRLPRPLRRHTEGCRSCATFAALVADQRKLMAVALPVAPSLALKQGILASIGGPGAGGVGATVGGATGGSLAGGLGGSGASGLAALVTKTGATQVAVLLIAASGAGIVGIEAGGSGDRPPVEAGVDGAGAAPDSGLPGELGALSIGEREIDGWAHDQIGRGDHQTTAGPDQTTISEPPTSEPDPVSPAPTLAPDERALVSDARAAVAQEESRFPAEQSPTTSPSKPGTADDRLQSHLSDADSDQPGQDEPEAEGPGTIEEPAAGPSPGPDSSEDENAARRAERYAKVKP